MDNSLQRFVDAQKADYEIAFSEIKQGRKRTHWMWYIFPQVRGLGFSETSVFYGISDIKEAEDFLLHPILSPRLIGICRALLDLPDNNATHILGEPDDLKLKSSMTLFAAIDNANLIFQSVLDKFFNGTPDHKTLNILGK